MQRKILHVCINKREKVVLRKKGKKNSQYVVVDEMFINRLLTWLLFS